MTPREIQMTTEIAVQEGSRRGRPTAEGRALIALRDLLVSFIDATDKGCPESIKAMSIDQVRILNQLHLAVGE